jgi:hypothetical protein
MPSAVMQHDADWHRSSSGVFEEGEHDLVRLGNAALLEMAVGKVVESSGLDKPAA